MPGLFWSGLVSGVGGGSQRLPAVANELGGTVYGPAVQAGSIQGGVHIHQAGPARMPVPRQLPGVPPGFTNRLAELARLDRLLAAGEALPVTVAVITGVGGAGKSSLAARWLSQVSGRFPGGELYAALGGSQAETPARPADVVGQFLRAVGVPPARVPSGLAEGAALWRSLTAGRRLVMLLDDATSASQVRAMLPGPGPSLVVATSRSRLAGLAIEGAEFIELGPLEEPDAVALLGRIARRRADAEPEAARTVVRLCGGLPLAVCVSAARLASHSRWRIQQVADELSSERHRLSALSAEEDLSVRTAFDVSYRGLPPAAARAYRVLSLLPGPEFSPELAATAAGSSLREMSALLETLAGASLLTEGPGGRFRFHDLIRLHARELADAGPAAEREAVTSRAVAWYLTKAVAADLVVIPGRWQLGGRYDDARERPPAFAEPAAALAWLELELPGLAGAITSAHHAGLHQEAWQLCEALWGLLLYRRHYSRWITLTETGLASARACGDLRAQARMRDQLGFAYLCLRRYPEAREQFSQAVTLARQAGHRLGTAAPLEHQGLTLLGLKRPAEALSLFQEARATHVELRRPRGIALMTRHIGEALADAGRPGEAIRALTEAKERFAALPDPYNECRAATELARTCLRVHRPSDAAALLGEALAVMTRLGALDKQADIHVLLADAAESGGDATGARRHLAAAVDLYENLGATEAGPVRARYAQYLPGAGASPPPAIAQDQPAPATRQAADSSPAHDAIRTEPPSSPESGREPHSQA